MAEQWPATLQDVANREGFSMQFGEETVTTEMEVGPPKKRRRTTKRIDTFPISIDMTFDEYSTLNTFYDVTLAGGVKTFNFTHPLTQLESEFQFVNPPTINPKGSGGRYFTVQMEWREV